MSYSQEYIDRLQSRGWRQLRAICFAITWGRCAVFPLLRANDLDHLHYATLGRELPLLDVVPLSRFVHRGLVTPARRILGRLVVNTVLRLCFGAWIVADGALVYWIFKFVKHAFIVGLVIALALPAEAHRHYASAYNRHGCNAIETWDCRSLAVKHEFWEMTGHPHGWKGHIIDHRRALDCGGADAVSNMQWETIAEAKAKDAWETVGCKDGHRVGPPAPGRPE